MIGRFSFLMMFFVLILGVSSCGSDDENDRSSGNHIPPRDDSHYPIASPSVVYLWLPNMSSNGNLGGIAGANATCQTAAAAADGGPTFETEVSTHRIFLSSSTQDARNFFANNPPVKRPDGTQIIDNYADYFNPRENLDDTVDLNDIIWTGMSKTGGSGDENCNDWTGQSELDNGLVGSAGYRIGARFSAGTSKCNEMLSIACMSC